MLKDNDARRAEDTLMEHMQAVHETLESWVEIEHIVRSHVTAAVAQAVNERDAIIKDCRNANDALRKGVGNLEAQLREREQEVERLRGALRHEIYRNHEHTDACSQCVVDAEALRAPNGGEG